MSSQAQAINLLAHVDTKRRAWPDLVGALETLDPGSPNLFVDVDLLACALCHGAALPGYDDENAEMKARLLISGVIGALVYRPGYAPLTLAGIREVIAVPALTQFCRDAVKLPHPYIRARLAAYAMPDTGKELLAVTATAAKLIDAHLRARRSTAPV